MATPIKRDLYADVTTRILAELEQGAPVFGPTCGQRHVEAASRGEGAMNLSPMSIATVPVMRQCMKSKRGVGLGESTMNTLAREHIDVGMCGVSVLTASTSPNFASRLRLAI
jgi:hypothetical protein